MGYTELCVSPQTFKLRHGKLIALSGPDQGKEFIIDGPETTIGSQKCSVILSDKTVSRKHAVIIESSGAFLIKDLKSTNGVFLNDLRVNEAYLEYGAIIKLGNAQLKFVPHEEAIEVFPSPHENFGKCYGNSNQMRNIFAILEKVSKSNISIIIEGETGTGKELLARAIHENSKRKNKPFIVFDSSATTKNLIESELFGHIKGSFTGAVSERAGVFEQANGGTIFLDEIGELPKDLQPKLLRLLENHELKKVGGSDTINIDVRVVAATNRDLHDEVKHKKFREDLYYRLSVLKVNIPPLRDRKEDIPVITENILKELSQVHVIEEPPVIHPEAIFKLKAYKWPGNVRELRNVLSQALAIGDRKIIKANEIIISSDRQLDTKKLKALSKMTLEDIEIEVIKEKLKFHKRNKTKVAKDLGIAYSTLWEKMKKYKIK